MNARRRRAASSALSSTTKIRARSDIRLPLACFKINQRTVGNMGFYPHNLPRNFLGDSLDYKLRFRPLARVSNQGRQKKKGDGPTTQDRLPESPQGPPIDRHLGREECS